MRSKIIEMSEIEYCCYAITTKAGVNGEPSLVVASSIADAANWFEEIVKIELYNSFVFLSEEVIENILNYN